MVNGLYDKKKSPIVNLEKKSILYVKVSQLTNDLDDVPRELLLPHFLSLIWLVFFKCTKLSMYFQKTRDLQTFNSYFRYET